MAASKTNSLPYKCEARQVEQSCFCGCVVDGWECQWKTEEEEVDEMEDEEDRRAGVSRRQREGKAR